MKIRSAELKTVCGYTSTLPQPMLPEIAFAGRSNVGKSSLINSLMQRKRLARVGETPGKTRTINFYEVDVLAPREAMMQDPDGEAGDLAARPDTAAGDNDQGARKDAASGDSGQGAELVPAKAARGYVEEVPVRFHLVDLPGYGYANVSVAEKQRWGKMIERYLRDERDLRAVFLLMDIRHEPNANDRQMYDWILKSGHTPVLIATKADKIKRSKVSGQLKVIRQALNTPKGSILLPFSALDGSGREAVCAQILRLM